VVFFVKWVAEQGGPARTSAPFETSAAALESACEMLRSFRAKPNDFWIEAGDGRRVMMEPAITMRCAAMGRVRNG
jgi:hypothetical protein